MHKPQCFTVLARAAVALAFVGMVPGLAQAQTYTLKALTTPTGVRCDVMTGQLSSTGDVAAQCDTTVATAASIASLFAALLAREGTYLQPGNTYQRIVHWRAAGTTLKITGGTGTSSQARLLGVLPDGSILGSYSDAATKRSGTAVWKNGTRSDWALPAGLPAGSWRYWQMSPSGKAIALYDAKTEGRYAVAFNGQVTVLPQAPSACVPKYTLAEKAAVSENGQLSVIAETAQATGGSYFDAQATVCAWRGGPWVGPQAVLKDGAPLVINDWISDPFGVAGMTPSGQVLLGGDGGPDVAWTPGGAFVTLPDNVRRIGLNEEWLGGSSDFYYPAEARATIWRNRQAVDLNTVTTLTSDQVLVTALDINAKGQILAVMVQPSLRDNSKSKLVILSPK